MKNTVSKEIVKIAKENKVLITRDLQSDLERIENKVDLYGLIFAKTREQYLTEALDFCRTMEGNENYSSKELTELFTVKLSNDLTISRKAEKYDEISAMMDRAVKENWNQDEIHTNLVRVTAYY